jgi:hypothetical protein
VIALLPAWLVALPFFGAMACALLGRATRTTIT